MRPRELRVVFDTSAVFSKAPTELLSHDVVTVISGLVGQEEPALRWYLPETVYLERRYQMLAKAASVLSHLDTARKILDRDLSVTKGDMEKGIERLLREQVEKYKLNVSPLNFGNVNWKAIADSATKRLPPFEKDNEKGFRDALVLETFMQVVGETPAPASKYRVGLVTKDGLLSDAAQKRIEGVSSARVFVSLDDLKGYVATLTKEVPEELIDALKPVANTFFYIEDDSSCLFAQENVKKRIKEEYADKLAEIPTGADKRENIAWRIDPPRFVDSLEKTITWASRVIVEAVATRSLQMTTGVINLGFGPGSLPSTQWGTTITSLPSGTTQVVEPVFPIYSGIVPSTSWEPSSAWQNAILGRFSGRSIFEVLWSAVSTESPVGLKDGKVLQIRFVETVWD